MSKTISEELNRHENLSRSDDLSRARLRALRPGAYGAETLKDAAEARELITRYVAKAGQQETRIEQLAADHRSAVEEAARTQADLEAAIRALAIDKKL